MILAHVDDETIFAGNKLYNSNDSWRIIYVAKPPRQRRIELNKVSRILGFRYEILGYKDCWAYKMDRNSLYNDIEKVVKMEDWNEIVTHHPKGEYGHPQHEMIGSAMSVIGMDLDTEVKGFVKGDYLPFDSIRRKMAVLDLYKSAREGFSNLMEFILKEDYEVI